MGTALNYQNDYLTGGATGARASPNFSLAEFADARGRVYVHRELVSALQALRNQLGQPLKIVSIPAEPGLPAGHAALVSAANSDALGAAARALTGDGWLERVEARGREVMVTIPDPLNPPPIVPEKALELAVAVTAAFETAGDPYLQVTGNFDGAGLSFGPLQVNFGSGSLQELMRRYRARNEAAMRRAFGALWTPWQEVLALPSRRRQVDWADGLSRGPGRAGFDPDWQAALQRLGALKDFRRETLAYAYDTYGRKLVVALAWLRGLRPLPITNFRCLAALYDLCVQQGSLDKAHDSIRSRVLREDPQDQFALTRIAVEERGRKAGQRWRADCISRRLSILERQPVEVVEGAQRAERDNPMLWMLRNADVTRIERYLL